MGIFSHRAQYVAADAGNRVTDGTGKKSGAPMCRARFRRRRKCATACTVLIAIVAKMVFRTKEAHLPRVQVKSEVS
jgi:hypothetical protein